MWRLLALVATILTASALRAEMRLENVHACYGRHAPERRTDVYYLYHDTLRYRFDVVDAHATPSGVSVQFEMKLSNAKGELVAYSSSARQEKLGLGGDRFRGYCELPMHGDWSPGAYTVMLTAADNNTGKTARFEQKVRVQTPELAVVGVKLAYTADGADLAATTVPLGQTLHLSLNVAGLKLHGDKAWCRYRVQVLDASTRHSVAETPVSEIHDRIPIGAPLTAGGAGELEVDLAALNRTGRFILHCQITDVNAHQSIDYDLPLHVVAP